MTQSEIKAMYLKALAVWMLLLGVALVVDGVLWFSGFDGDHIARAYVARSLEMLFRFVAVLVMIYFTTMAMAVADTVDDTAIGVGMAHAALAVLSDRVEVLDAKVDALADVPADYVDDDDLDELYLDLDEDDDIDLLDDEDDEDEDEPFHPGIEREPLRTTY